MLKNYLLSHLCSTLAPHLSLFQLSFSFSLSASFFCFSLLVSASFFCFFSFGQRPFFCFSPLFLFNFGAPFLLQRPSPFVQPSLFLFVRLPFIFQSKILFFSPNFFQPKCFLVFQPKRFCFSSTTVLFFFFFALFFSGSALFFLFQCLLFFLFFSSVYPRPNILSSCFTSLLFE